jgi:glutamate-1-semialdehyde 2,1-aminomutase
LNLICRNRSGDIDLGFKTLVAQELVKKRVLMPWISFSLSHGEPELEQTLEAFESALQPYLKGLEQGLSDVLEGPSIKPVFRKFN